jgi:hypothetical protein
MRLQKDVRTCLCFFVLRLIIHASLYLLFENMIKYEINLHSNFLCIVKSGENFTVIFCSFFEERFRTISVSDSNVYIQLNAPKPSQNVKVESFNLV